MNTSNHLNTIKPPWEQLSIYEACNVFQFKWQRELHEIHQLLEAIKMMLIFYVLTGVCIAFGLHAILSLYQDFNRYDVINDLTMLIAVVMIGCSLFLYDGHKYWYNYATNQYLYVSLCMSLEPELLQDYQKINAKSSFQPKKSSFYNLYKLITLIERYENKHIIQPPEQY